MDLESACTKTGRVEQVELFVRHRCSSGLFIFAIFMFLPPPSGAGRGIAIRLNVEYQLTIINHVEI